MPMPKEVTVEKLIARLRDCCQFYIDVIQTDIEDLGDVPPGVGVPANMVREQTLADDVRRMQNAMRALDALKPHLPALTEAADMAYLTALIKDDLGDDPDNPTCDKCDGKLNTDNEFEMHTGVCSDCAKNEQQKRGQCEDCGKPAEHLADVDCPSRFCAECKRKREVQEAVADSDNCNPPSLQECFGRRDD